jgi:hypothetical protein
MPALHADTDLAACAAGAAPHTPELADVPASPAGRGYMALAMPIPLRVGGMPTASNKRSPTAPRSALKATVANIVRGLPTPVAKSIKARRVSFGANKLHAIPARGDHRYSVGSGHPFPELSAPLPLVDLPAAVAAPAPGVAIPGAPATKPKLGLPTPVKQQIRAKGAMAEIAARRKSYGLPVATVAVATEDGDAIMEDGTCAPTKPLPEQAQTPISPPAAVAAVAVTKAGGVPTPVRQQIRAKSVLAAIAARRTSYNAVESAQVAVAAASLIDAAAAAPAAVAAVSGGAAPRVPKVLSTPMRQQIRARAMLEEIARARRYSSAPEAAAASVEPMASAEHENTADVATATAAEPGSNPTTGKRGMPTPVRQQIRAKSVLAQIAARRRQSYAASAMVPEAAANGGVDTADSTSTEAASGDVDMASSTSTAAASEPVAELSTEAGEAQSPAPAVKQSGMPTPVRQQIRAKGVLAQIAARRKSYGLPAVAAHPSEVAPAPEAVALAASAPSRGGMIAKHTVFAEDGVTVVTETAVDVEAANQQHEPVAEGDQVAPAATRTHVTFDEDGQPLTTVVVAVDVDEAAGYEGDADDYFCEEDECEEEVAELESDDAEEKGVGHASATPTQGKHWRARDLDDLESGVVCGRHVFFFSPEGVAVPPSAASASAADSKYDWAYNVDAGEETVEEQDLPAYHAAMTQVAGVIMAAVVDEAAEEAEEAEQAGDEAEAAVTSPVIAAWAKPKLGLPTPVKQQIRAKGAMAEIAARRKSYGVPVAAVAAVTEVEEGDGDVVMAAAEPLSEPEQAVMPPPALTKKGIPTPVKQQIRAKGALREIAARRKSYGTAVAASAAEPTSAPSADERDVDGDVAMAAAAASPVIAGKPKTGLPTPVRQQIRAKGVMAAISKRRKSYGAKAQSPRTVTVVVEQGADEVDDVACTDAVTEPGTDSTTAVLEAASATVGAEPEAAPAAVDAEPEAEAGAAAGGDEEGEASASESDSEPGVWDDESDPRYHRRNKSILYAASEGRLSTVYEADLEEEEARAALMATEDDEGEDDEEGGGAAGSSSRKGRRASSRMSTTSRGGRGRATATPVSRRASLEQAAVLGSGSGVVAASPAAAVRSAPVTASSTPAAAPTGVPVPDVDESASSVASARKRGRKSLASAAATTAEPVVAAPPVDLRAAATAKPARGAAKAAAAPAAAAATPVSEDACVLCSSEVSRRNNLLVLCDGCDKPHHQKCVGLEVVPDGKWFCPPCHEAVAVAKLTGGKRKRVVAAASPLVAEAAHAVAVAASAAGRGGKAAAAAPTADAPAAVEGMKVALDAAAIEGMKVTELRAALEARGLDGAGLKAALVARLKAALAHKAAADPAEAYSEEAVGKPKRARGGVAAAAALQEAAAVVADKAPAPRRGRAAAEPVPAARASRLAAAAPAPAAVEAPAGRSTRGRK